MITVVLCVLAALCEGVDLQAAGIAAAGVTGEFHPTPDQLGTFCSASSFVGPKYGGLWKALGLGSSGVLLKLLPVAIAGSVLAIVLSCLPVVRRDRED